MYGSAGYMPGYQTCDVDTLLKVDGWHDDVGYDDDDGGNADGSGGARVDVTAITT